MKYLCLAYGREADWKALSKEEQDALLVQDDVLRDRGDLVAAVGTDVTAVRAWNGTPETDGPPVIDDDLPLAGFAIVEASSLEDAIEMIANTPCARTNGAVEVRPIIASNAVRLEGTGRQTS